MKLTKEKEILVANKENLLPYTWNEKFFEKATRDGGEFEFAKEGIMVGGRLIGVSLEGASYRSAETGARVEILPFYDPTIGMVSYGADGSTVFKTVVSGDDIGDVVIGDLTGDKFVHWDYSEATLTIKGILVAGTNSSIDIDFLTGVANARVLGRTTAGSGAVEELSAGAGISITGGQIACSITQYTDEMVDDRVASLIQNGTGITWSYNDNDGTLTPTVSISQYTDEMAQDAVGGMIVNSDTINLIYVDATPSLTADLNLGMAITKLSTTTGINAKTVATTNLYTVPTGKTAIITMAVIRVTMADTITVIPTAGIGVAAGESDIFAATALTGLDATTKIYTFNASGQYVNVATGGIIKLGVDVGATATTMIIAVDLFGYLI